VLALDANHAEAKHNLKILLRRFGRETDLERTSTTAAPTSSGSIRLQRLEHEEFTARFGNLDTSEALCEFTPPGDTRIVLTLLAHYRPRRILEIGTGAGHMTANLTRWSQDVASIYSLGTFAGMAGTGSAPLQVDAPSRGTFGRVVGHFGQGHKVRLIAADSLSYDFKQISPLDFIFIDGAHDLEHVLSDTRNAYRALSSGGCLVWHDFDSPVPWVEVKRAVERAGLPEAVYHVVGTQVAFLMKK
jgi:predicted O-methyltransferase YrrM